MFRKLRLFGRAKNDGTRVPLNPAAEAIRKLRETEDLFVKKQQFLEEKIKEQADIIRANGMKNKVVAKRALLKKHRLEKGLENVVSQLTNIEIQRETLESSNMNTEVFKTMTGAAGALKTVHKTLDVDKVHEIMDEISEQQDIGREIIEAICKPTGFGTDVDDDELERELDALNQEELDSVFLSVNKPKVTVVDSANDASDDDKTAPSSSGPPKPKTEGTDNKPGMTKQEEADLKALQSWVID